MPGRPKDGRKSQVYKRKMANLAKGIKEDKKEEKKADSKEVKKEKKKESKVEKVKKIFKD